MNVYTSHNVTTHRYATDGQIKYLKDLLTNNELYAGEYDRLWKLLAVHELDVRTPGDGTRMPFAQASASIDWVKRQIVKKSGPSWQESSLLTPTALYARQKQEQVATSTETPEAVKFGVYQKDGEVYLVVPNKAGDRVYAKRLVELEQITEAGVTVDFIWEYAPRVIWNLTEADRMSLEDAAKLSVRYGKCLRCKRTLKSVHTLKTAEDTGILLGPVCRKFFA